MWRPRSTTSHGASFFTIYDRGAESHIMPKYKPKTDNVVRLRTNRSSRTAATKRLVNRLRPHGLSPALRAEWNQIATVLADPAIDRLCDVIVEFCVATLRLRNLRSFFVLEAERRALETGLPPDPLDAEIYRVESRNGEQVKAHPHVGQLNEAWHQWRALVGALGLSPADARGLGPRQGEQFDDQTGLFA
jgi:hypothetical protein